MSVKPDVTVAAVIESDGRFLVVQERIRGRLVLNQPAGHVEDRETLLQGVIREVREETAWLFTPSALLGIYHWRNPNTGLSTIRFAFRGQVSDHRPLQKLDAPIVGTHWLTDSEISLRAAELRYPLVWRCIEDYQAGKSVPLEAVASIDLASAARLRAVNV